MLDEKNELPEDYKITCFNGKVDNIMVCKDRFSKEGVKFYFFDKDWNFLRYNYGDEKLPEGFQTAEFLLEHGFIDKIVERKDLKNTLSNLIQLNK